MYFLALILFRLLISLIFITVAIYYLFICYFCFTLYVYFIKLFLLLWVILVISCLHEVHNLMLTSIWLLLYCYNAFSYGVCQAFS